MFTRCGSAADFPQQNKIHTNCRRFCIGIKTPINLWQNFHYLVWIFFRGSTAGDTCERTLRQRKCCFSGLCSACKSGKLSMHIPNVTIGPINPKDAKRASFWLLWDKYVLVCFFFCICTEKLRQICFLGDVWFGMWSKILLTSSDRMTQSIMSAQNL